MAMDNVECAKRIKEAMDKHVDKSESDYNTSGDKDKDTSAYEEKIAAKNEKEANDKLAKKLAEVLDKKLPSIPEKKLNEGIACPNCGHKNCGCSFHKEQPTQPEPTTPEEEPNIDDLLKEGDIDKLKDLLDNSPNMPLSNEFLKTMAKEIDDEFQKAESSLNIPSPIPLPAKGSLSLNLKSNFVLNAIEVGVKVSLYWSMCVVPMVSVLPQYMGMVTVVTNDATKIASTIAQKLIQLSKNAKPNDDYKEFCNIIIEEVKTITWNITEIIPGSPPVTQQYTATVS